MRLLIACDMEGITGVTRWEHCMPEKSEYGRFRQVMTDDVNAAIEGAFAGGADEIFVADGHHRGQNLLIEKLNQSVIYNNGTASPWSMMNGIEKKMDAVLFIGYHAKAGTANAILAHTWMTELLDLRVNQQSFGEFGLNAMIAGHFNTPILMVSGDQRIAEEAANFLPGIETAIVKESTGYFTGNCLPPTQSAKIISRTAQKALENFRQGKAPQPFKISTPVDIEAEFAMPHMAEFAARMPGAARRSGRSVGLVCHDVPEAFTSLRTMCNLAN